MCMFIIVEAVHVSINQHTHYGFIVSAKKGHKNHHRCSVRHDQHCVMLKIVVYASPYIQSNNQFKTIIEYIETDN